MLTIVLCVASRVFTATRLRTRGRRRPTRRRYALRTEQGCALSVLKSVMAGVVSSEAEVTVPETPVHWWHATRFAAAVSARLSLTSCLFDTGDTAARLTVHVPFRWWGQRLWRRRRRRRRRLWVCNDVPRRITLHAHTLHSSHGVYHKMPPPVVSYNLCWMRPSAEVQSGS